MAEIDGNAGEAEDVAPEEPQGIGIEDATGIIIGGVWAPDDTLSPGPGKELPVFDPALPSNFPGRPPRVVDVGGTAEPGIDISEAVAAAEDLGEAMWEATGIPQAAESVAAQASAAAAGEWIAETVSSAAEQVEGSVDEVNPWSEPEIPVPTTGGV